MISKKLAISLIVLIIIPFCNCNDDDLPGPHWGSASAYLNGEDWSDVLIYSGFEKNSTRFFIWIRHYNKDGYLRQSISLKYLPLDIGRIVPSEDADSLVRFRYTPLLDHGDVVGAGYTLDTTDSIMDFVEIEKILDNGEIFGKFQFSFRKSKSTGMNDRLVFEDGHFHTRVDGY